MAVWMLICCVCAAVSAALAAALVWQSWHAGRKARYDIHLLQRLPPLWRLMLPCLRRLCWCARPFLGWRTRPRLALLLEHAGLAGALDPLLLRTAQCVLACVAALAACVLVSQSGLVRWWALLAVSLLIPLAWHWPCMALASRARERRRRMASELPLALEIMALCLAGGQHFNGALQQLVRHAPEGALKQELGLAWAEIKQGRPRVETVRAVAQRTDLPAMRRLAGALAQADTLGMALGPLLTAQSRQLQDERFQLAEKRAMEAPVKMLLPLMTCIFPCTFLVLAYPLAYYLQMGMAA